MKLRIIVLMALLSSVEMVFGQERAGDDLRSSLGLYSGDLLNFYNEVSRNKMLDQVDLSGIDGTPYLNGEFEKGFVVTKDSVQYAGLDLRYNIYNDVIEFKKNDLAMELNESFPFLYAVVNDQAFVKADNEDGYFQVVASGDVYLLKKLKMKFVDPKPASGYQSFKRPSFSELKPDYYIEKQIGGDAFQIKNADDLAKIFADKAGEIKAFVKKEKVKADKETDLLKVLNYYNSIK